MNTIDQIKAEIERLKKQLVRGACAAQIQMETSCKDEAYNEVLSFLDTLQEQPVCEDVEMEIKETELEYQQRSERGEYPASIESIARHFYELGRQSKSNIEICPHSIKSKSFSMRKEQPVDADREEIIGLSIMVYLDTHLKHEGSIVCRGVTHSEAREWIRRQIARGESEKPNNHLEQPVMIQWTGNNLKDIIEFTGKSPRFDEWFKTWDEYESYVHSHGDILKLFNEDGTHLEVPVGAWIFKTPDGRNVPSTFLYQEQPVCEGLEEEIDRLWENGLSDELSGPHNSFDVVAKIARHFAQWQKEQMMKQVVECRVCHTKLTDAPVVELYAPVGYKVGDKIRIIIVKEDEK